MSDNGTEVGQPAENNSEREEPGHKSAASQSSDDSSDGSADSKDKPATSEEGHSNPPPFMLQGSLAGNEAAPGGNSVHAIPNPNPSQHKEASAGFSNMFGSLNFTTNTASVEPVTPMNETFTPVNSDVQDFNLSNSRFSNINLPFSAQSMQNSETMFRNHNLSTSTLPSEFHYGPNQAAEGSTGNNGLPNLGNEWPNWNPQRQFNIHDSAITPLGSQDFQYQALLNQTMGPCSGSYPTARGSSQQNQYQNMPLTTSMEGFNMGSYYNPTYNYLENFPLQATKLADWVSQAPGPEAPNNLNVPPPPDTPNSNSSGSRAIKNSVYDPMYEAMGLPVDPHLRMFMARRENGIDD